MAFGNRTPAHIGGIDAPSPGAPGKTLSVLLIMHFQLRPDPLAHYRIEAIESHFARGTPPVVPEAERLAYIMLSLPTLASPLRDCGQ
jgi:hypothetical protein